MSTTKHTPMVKKYKTLWLKALRSGKYKQGTGTLKQTTGGGTSTYCCLGVLQECIGAKIPMDTDIFGVNATPSKRAELSVYMERKTGIKDQGTLINMNDVKKFSFKRIANWIEKNL